MYKLFYSPILRTFFQKFSENKISQKILKKEFSLIETNITCIDLDVEGYLSFIQTDKVEKILKDNRRMSLENYDSLDAFWIQDLNNSESTYGMWTKSRNQIKIGRFVNQLFPNEFSTKEVEDFVNLVKSKQNVKDEFQLVSGEDIRYWYNEAVYYTNCGDLGGSCMREDVRQPYFDIYTKNPKCKMLILKKDNLLVGRSIIWKVDYKSNEINFEYAMDRVYTNKPSDILKFHEYAKENNWARKYKNTYSDELQFVINDNKYDAKVNFQLEINEYEQYPYVDTFKYYNPLTGIIQNYTPDERGFYELKSTSGSYSKWELRKTSRYYQGQIVESQAVWSDRLQDWLYRNDSVEVTIGAEENRGLYPDNHTNIRYEPYLRCYVHINDCVYSEYYREHLLRENAERVYILNSFYQIRKLDWLSKDNLKETGLISEITNERFNAIKSELDSNIKLYMIL